MILADLKTISTDKAYVYFANKPYDGTYTDVYKGKLRDLPYSLQDEKVFGVFARRKGILDIEIER